MITENEKWYGNPTPEESDEGEQHHVSVPNGQRDVGAGETLGIVVAARLRRGGPEGPGDPLQN